VRLDPGCARVGSMPAAVHFSGRWARCRCNPSRGLGGRDAGVKPTWTYSRRPLAELHRHRFAGKPIRDRYNSQRRRTIVLLLNEDTAPMQYLEDKACSRRVHQRLGIG